MSLFKSALNFFTGKRGAETQETGQEALSKAPATPLDVMRSWAREAALVTTFAVGASALTGCAQPEDRLGNKSAVTATAKDAGHDTDAGEDVAPDADAGVDADTSFVESADQKAAKEKQERVAKFKKEFEELQEGLDSHLPYIINDSQNLECEYQTAELVEASGTLEYTLKGEEDCAEIVVVVTGDEKKAEDKDGKPFTVEIKTVGGNAPGEGDFKFEGSELDGSKLLGLVAKLVGTLELKTVESVPSAPTAEADEDAVDNQVDGSPTDDGNADHSDAGDEGAPDAGVEDAGQPTDDGHADFADVGDEGAPDVIVADVPDPEEVRNQMVAEIPSATIKSQTLADTTYSFTELTLKTGESDVYTATGTPANTVGWRNVLVTVAVEDDDGSGFVYRVDVTALDAANGDEAHTFHRYIGDDLTGLDAAVLAGLEEHEADLKKPPVNAEAPAPAPSSKPVPAEVATTDAGTISIPTEAGSWRGSHYLPNALIKQLATDGFTLEQVRHAFLLTHGGSIHAKAVPLLAGANGGKIDVNAGTVDYSATNGGAVVELTIPADVGTMFTDVNNNLAKPDFLRRVDRSIAKQTGETPEIKDSKTADVEEAAVSPAVNTGAELADIQVQLEGSFAELDLPTVDVASFTIDGVRDLFPDFALPTEADASLASQADGLADSQLSKREQEDTDLLEIANNLLEYGDVEQALAMASLGWFDDFVLPTEADASPASQTDGLTDSQLSKDDEDAELLEIANNLLAMGEEQALVVASTGWYDDFALPTVVAESDDDAELIALADHLLSIDPASYQIAA